MPWYNIIICLLWGINYEYDLNIYFASKLFHTRQASKSESFMVYWAMPGCWHNSCRKRSGGCISHDYHIHADFRGWLTWSTEQERRHNHTSLSRSIRCHHGCPHVRVPCSGKCGHVSGTGCHQSYWGNFCEVSSCPKNACKDSTHMSKNILNFRR